MPYTVSEIAFACYSAVCRPPGKNGGTGGSVKGGAHDAPISDAAKASMRALKKEADGIAKDVDSASTDAEFSGLEGRVTAFGTKVHAALEKVLESDERMNELKALTQKHHDEAERLMAVSKVSFKQARFIAKVAHSNNREMDETERSEYDRLLKQDEDSSDQAQAHHALKTKGNRLIVQRRASVIGQALNEIVPMGGEVAGVPAHKPRKDKWGNVGLTINEQMTFAAKVYPKAWIEMSNDYATGPHDDSSGTDSLHAYMRRPLVFRKSTARAHYNDSLPVTATVRSNYRSQKVSLTDSTTLTEITANGRVKAKEAYASVRVYDEITLNDDIGTGVHEYAHRMEHMMPSVKRMERTFVERRAGTSTTQKLGKGFRSDEVYIPDNLFDKYAEKVYRDGSNEVISMGWEHYVTNRTTSHESSSTRPNRPDPEHMGLILGLMTTVRRTTKPRKMTRQ